MLLCWVIPFNFEDAILFYAMSLSYTLLDSQRKGYAATGLRHDAVCTSPVEKEKESVACL